MLCDCFCCCVFICFLPLFSPIDAESADDPVDDYFTIEDPFLSTNQPGKQPPLMHAYITYSLSLLLALEIAAATVLSYSDA
jgi:hypothetical protein